jgi:HEAT repeat protein
MGTGAEGMTETPRVPPAETVGDTQVEASANTDAEPPVAETTEDVPSGGATEPSGQVPPPDEPLEAPEPDPTLSQDTSRDEIASLVTALQGEDASARVQAAEKLQELGAEPVSALIGVLKHENRNVRRLAAEILSNIGPEAKQSVPALVETLEDQDPNVRLWAASALGAIGAEAELAVPALIEALDEQNPYICVRVVTALGQFGPDAKDALPKLYEIVDAEGQEQFLRDAAREAVGKIERAD